MNRIKRVIISAIVAMGFVAPVMAPVAASAADINGNLCAGANLSVSGSDSCASDLDADEKIDSIITDVINIFSLVVGVAAVLMIIVGGFKYITSGGESGNVTGAKNTIMYAIIGLVVVALSQLVVKFVLQKVTTSTTS